MGLFSSIGGLLGIGGNKKAIQGATNAANLGITNAVNQNNTQIGANNTAYSPYTQAGADATTSVAGLLGLNGGDSQSSAIEALKQSPMFQSLFDEGNRTVLQDAAATGGVRGGNTTTSLAKFGSGLLGSTIQQQLANLMGLSGQGLSAVGQQQGLNTGLSNGIAGLLDQQGQNNSAAILGKKAVTNNAFNGAYNFLDASPSSGGGGSNGGNIINAIMSLF